MLLACVMRLTQKSQICGQKTSQTLGWSEISLGESCISGLEAMLKWLLISLLRFVNHKLQQSFT